MELIKMKNLYKTYQQGTKTIKAVDDISINVNVGEFLAVIGQSGSGKSTLLQLIGGLDRPTSGGITVGNIDLTKISETRLTALRRDKMGFVFQNFNLIPTLTAAQNVEAVISYRSKQDKQKVMATLKQVGLAERANHLPSLLSGGEQQRVAIARALINNPDIILADEPTGNLDSRTGEDIMAILGRLNRDEKKTVVVISHSDYVKKYASQVIEIRDGKIS